MSLITDRLIRLYSVGIAGMVHRPGEPLLEPFSEGTQGDDVISYGLTSAGYDLRLGYKYLAFKNTTNSVVCPKRMKQDPDYRKRFLEEVTADDVGEPLKAGSRIVVPGHSYILGYSLEHIIIPRTLKGRCVGKSTYARCGLVINTTPLEPGWRGHLTIEIANTCPCPVAIYAGEGIAQLEFDTLATPVEVSYADKAGKYQNQGAEPVPATVK